jgi:Fe-Mn family superoxide dismutase
LKIADARWRKPVSAKPKWLSCRRSVTLGFFPPMRGPNKENLMKDELTRRDVVTRTLPALALAGIALAPRILLAQADAGATGGGSSSSGQAGFKDGVYVLPPLPYAYDALEPYIDADTMHLHHDKHHQGYVTGLNNTIKALAALDAAPEPNAALLVGLQEDLSFNAGGHLLHTLFWTIMGPKAGGEPVDGIAEALKRDFGSVDAFKTRFARVAAGVKGSGWALLAYEPLGDRLIVLQVKQHDLQLAPGAVPILPLDVWEHAYYLKYHNVRADYVKAWWNVVNWGAVNDAFTSARHQAGKA